MWNALSSRLNSPGLSTVSYEIKLCMEPVKCVLSPWRGASLGCGWRRQPAGVLNRVGDRQQAFSVGRACGTSTVRNVPRMWWARHAARTGETGNPREVLAIKPEGRDSLEDCGQMRVGGAFKRSARSRCEGVCSLQLATSLSGSSTGLLYLRRLFCLHSAVVFQFQLVPVAPAGFPRILFELIPVLVCFYVVTPALLFDSCMEKVIRNVKTNPGETAFNRTRHCLLCGETCCRNTVRCA
jgi:hypothetical protein